MFASTTRGLGTCLAAALFLVPQVPSVPSDVHVASVRATPTPSGGFVAPDASVETLEASAVELVDRLGALTTDDGDRCPADRLAVSWLPPEPDSRGTHIEPLGPRPAPWILDVNGIVVCLGDAVHAGFEAHRQGPGWWLALVPPLEGPPPAGLVDIGSPMEPLATDVARQGLAGLAELPLGPVDPYAAYDPQTTCDATAKPGTVALARLLIATVPGTGSLGITRACELGPTSEHKEGRAFDWSVAPAQRDLVDRVLAQLLATDAGGDAHALARRMGVMYVVWDGHIWSSHRPEDGWRVFAGSDPHQTHVHVSLSWDGALGRTSLWRAGEAAGLWDLPPVAVTALATSADDVLADAPSPATPSTTPAPASALIPVADPASDSPSEVPRPSAPPPASVPPPPPAPDPSPAPSGSPSVGPTSPRPARVVLVQFDEDLPPSARTSLRREAGAALSWRGRALPDLEAWEVPGGGDPGVARGLAARPGVRHVELDRTIVATSWPDDPAFAEQWGLAGAYGIDVPRAWEVVTDAPDVPVAVVDSGLDLDHPDLAPNLWRNPGEVAGNGLDDDANGYVDDVHGWDFCQDDAVPDDDNGHGTHVAGTVGAVGDNATAVAGIVWRAGLVPLKVLCADGSGSIADAVAALDYAVDLGIPISNNSWAWTGTPSVTLDAALTAATEAGHLFVAAAGNQAGDNDVVPTWPATYPHASVVAVAATGPDGAIWTGSNWGATTVDLAAPGVGIVSTARGGGVGSRTGTSHAAPHVTGTAALLLGLHPEWTASDLVARLLDSVTPDAGLASRVLTGGILDAGAALAPDAPPPPEEQVLAPTAQRTTFGSVVGTLADLAVVDGAGQQVVEVVTGTRSRATSALEHAWLVDVPSGTAQLEITASLTDSGEGDDVVVAWSQDDMSYTPVARVVAGQAATTQVVPLGEVAAGSLWIRVADVVRTRGAASLDTLGVDRVVVVVTPGADEPVPPPPAPDLWLTAVADRVKGVRQVRLSWVGASTVVVWRDGGILATVDGTDHIDVLDTRGTYRYQVCAVEGGACSNTVVVTS